MNYNLTPEVKKAIQHAQTKARANAQATFAPAHLLWGLLHEEVGLEPLLHHLDKDVHKLRRWAEFRIDRYPKSSQPVEKPQGDEKVIETLMEADRFRKKGFVEAIRPVHVLHAICQPDVAFSTDYLQRFPISGTELEQYLGEEAEMAEVQEAVNAIPPSEKKAASAKALAQYCEDLTLKARQGKIDPVIGRDKEIKKLVEILGKRLSPNVMITGEPGVGKTAIVGGLALNILEGRAPDNLKDATIFELDVNGRLVAGAYKGEVEERLKSTLKAIKDYGKAILFIDEIHVLLDEQSSVGSGAVNLLKPELSRGELTVIGATTSAEYRKHIETDEAFSRRFTALEIEEPNEEKAIEMLRGLAPRFEEHHQLQVDGEAIPEAVRLSRRYLATKKLPVSAIELLDLSLSSLRVMNDTSTMELEKLRNELEILAFAEEEAEESRRRRLRQFYEEIRGRLSHILISRVEEVFTLEPEAPPDQVKEQLFNLLDLLRDHSKEKTEEAGKGEIAAMVSYMTGIPLGKIQSQEQEKILNMESLLRQRVVGQDYALKMVADTLRRSRADLKEADKPNGVFFFVGPTGTGKTELAKAIAELLFNDERALIRFDMSEFKEEHSAALLYGAPPGYVGYKEGGLLVNKIRQKPYSVVLFDEIEKAHSSVYDIFLQIVDEGIVTDKQDKKGRFANAIVIFTSNLGSDWVIEQYKQGKVPEKNELRTFMQNLRDIRGNNVFRPEFLGRKINLVPFGPITQEIAPQILGIHLGNFAKLLRRQNIGLELTEKAKAKLVELGFSEVFGARPLKDAIDDYLGTPISEMIIRQEAVNGGKIFVDSDPKSGAPFVWKVENGKVEMLENPVGETMEKST